ncbi:MAG TPA: helix-turn-helix transcriptional regulator [Streptosporangiaceae bacterium]|nr:helix-turn-helix transcriptional regulator [Streptosporangiaceae bacterium]
MNGGNNRVGTCPDLSFGDRLRQCRRDAELSLEQLAERSGMSVRAISDMERGRTGRPRRSSVELLAWALGVHPGHLARAARGTATRVPPELHGMARAPMHHRAPGAAAHLAARVIDTAERELGPGGGSVLLAALTRALSSEGSACQ